MTSKWTKITVINIFKDIGISIDIQTHLKVDFTKVTLNIQNGNYRSYKKSNDNLCYILQTIHYKSSNSYQIPSLKDC